MRASATILLLLAPALAAAQDGGSGVDLSSLVRLTLGLAVVVLAILGLGWLLRRTGAGVAGGVTGQLRLLGGLSVGNRERVVLVQVGGRQLLLGVAPGRVQTLHVLEENLEPARGESAGGEDFASRLRGLMGQGGAKP
ncbi:flagellar biosynthetic protein FliO [Sediminicurvatus halobius]|uniref:Flagellar protein n=1 Tax=Sediminicurvatus halobius TaxID=2182432 RepID=A0A2U2N3A8_9GAMM|nr:flagellar biosynthetic protein FliO [Spiribacter halobius]PWG63656.1 flagellar biosynthetic protein FliO [Spiribacter halobius]UEX79794.1 flagellar biosynthetic protein FliO [Spiribacter halobius]